MKKNTIFVYLLLFVFIKGFAQTAPAIVPNQISGMVGFWDFENNATLFQSTSSLGLDLVLGGSSGTITQIAGPTGADMAISKTTGKYLNCNHGIPANGPSTTKVNQYSLVIDFRVPTVNSWRCFYQTNLANTDDGDCFMNTSGNIGVAAIGYSASVLNPNEWYRLVMSVDCGNNITYFIDGQQWVPGAPDALDGRFSLALGGMLLFADDNGEDGAMDIAKVVLFNRAINSTEVLALGGYGHTPTNNSSVTSMQPYLQTPTPTSMYICWHSLDATNPVVTYGTTANNLSQAATGTSQLINGDPNYRWHTVQLTGLLPNTEYFYKCYSGIDSTPTPIAFKTTALLSTPGQHFRFIVLGDNRTDIVQSSDMALKISNKLTQLYGPDYHRYINLICSVGDIVTDGSFVSQYEDEYFTPFAPLTKNIPSMISIGNHENNSSMFYQYMKYESLTPGYPAPHPYNEKFYDLELGPAQFLFLNANTLYRTAPQTTWLNNRLMESDTNQNVDFVFSFTHQPGHSEVWPDGNENYVQTNLFGLMKTYHKCAFHYDGHSHNYERGIVEMVNPDSTQQHDMRQMLSGGAGSALDRWGMYPNQTNYYEINKSLDIYCWTLVDIDVDNKSYVSKTYSMGNINSPQINLLVDSFYRKINQPGPLKATAAGVVNSSILVAFPMQGVDSAMTCDFQVTNTLGNYTTPYIERKQDKYDWYGDSGTPNWLPIDLNTNLDIMRYAILPSDNLIVGNTYGFRVRYKDNNLEWGKWSDEKTFVYSNTSTSTAVDFAADSLNVPVGFTVSFSDLSSTVATSWSWDCNNDGTPDSYLQDPFYQYNTPGYYTVTLDINGGGPGNNAIKTSYIHVYVPNGVETNQNQNILLTVNPNPFQSSTTIQYFLKKSESVRIEITDNTGKIVRNLTSGKQNAGQQSIVWNGKSDNGSQLPSGSYVVTVQGESFNSSKVVILENK